MIYFFRYVVDALLWFLGSFFELSFFDGGACASDTFGSMSLRKQASMRLQPPALSRGKGGHWTGLPETGGPLLAGKFVSGRGKGSKTGYGTAATDVVTGR